MLGSEELTIFSQSEAFIQDPLTNDRQAEGDD